MQTAAFAGHSQDARQQRMNADKARRQVIAFLRAAFIAHKLGLYVRQALSI